MAKEKTRAELHVIIEGLKNDLENATIHQDEQKKKYDALLSEHEACEKSLNHANKVIEEKNAEINELKDSLSCAQVLGCRLQDERDNARLELYCERNDWENKEQGFNKIIADMGKCEDQQRDHIEHIEADLAKAQYIADDLLGHGIFHFLIVKYRNSHSNGKKS